MKTTLPLKKFLLLICISMAVFSCGPSRRGIPIEEGWDLLGEQKVDFIKDKDAINVRSSYKYTAIRFKVEAHEIKLKDLKIYYQNGDKLEPQVDDIIAADQYSREIDLSPEGKFINKLEFKYHTVGNVLKGRANVLVFGKRYTGY